MDAGLLRKGTFPISLRLKCNEGAQAISAPLPVCGNFSRSREMHREHQWTFGHGDSDVLTLEMLGVQTSKCAAKLTRLIVAHLSLVLFSR